MTQSGESDESGAREIKMRLMSMTQPGESDESGARGGKVSHGSAVTHAHQCTMCSS